MDLEGMRQKNVPSNESLSEVEERFLSSLEYAYRDDGLLDYSSDLSDINQANVKSSDAEIQYQSPSFELKHSRHLQVPGNFQVLLNGPSQLSEEILDLLFDSKPLSNFSSMMYGLEHFVPSNKIENVLLLGILKRAIIVYGTKDMVLFKCAYTDIYALNILLNEFVLSLLRFNQCSLLLKLIETIVICSNYCSNVLLQYALLLDKMGHWKIALEYFILIADASGDCSVYFFIIQIYFHMHDFDSGIEWCYKLFKSNKSQSDAAIKSKCYLYIGIGYFTKYLNAPKLHVKKPMTANQENLEPSIIKRKDVSCETLRSGRCHAEDTTITMSEIDVVSLETVLDADEYLSTSTETHDFISSPLNVSMSNLKKAATFDDKNPVIFYYLSLINAHKGDMKEAMAHIKQSLLLNAEYLPSLHLLVLLESSHNLGSAQVLIDSIMTEYPDHIELYLTQAYISLAQEEYTKVLDQLKEALMVWKKLFGEKGVDHGCCFNDADSGQFSVDYGEKNSNPNCTCAGNTDSLDNSYGSSDSLSLKDVSRHVTFQNALSNFSCPEKPTSFNCDQEMDSRVENFHSIVGETFYSCTISHDDLPSKHGLLLNIWAMLARVYLVLDMGEDFVQCLREMLSICDVTIHFLGCLEQSTVEPMSSTVLSKHCSEVLLHLGLYYKKKKQFAKARKCFNDLLSIYSQHVEALYHRACVEFELGLFHTAVLNVQQCLQLHHVGVFKAKLYVLMGEVYNALEEPENAARAFEIALMLHGTMPVCSYDVIPFVMK